jgi:hypothetical protein
MGYNLFLDDERSPMDVFSYTQRFFYVDRVWLIVRCYDEFIDIINKNGLPSIISFDHDLSDVENGTDKEKTGLDCAKWLIEYCLDNEMKVPDYYVHSYNNVGSENIIKYIENYKKIHEV